MRLLSDIPDGKLASRRILLRVDLNVPLVNGVVRDDFRIKRIIPTVRRLLEARAQVILLSHSGTKNVSLAGVATYLEQFFPTRFACQISEIPPSTTWPAAAVVLLENLRLTPAEENNSPVLAKQLAALADLYVNEAFSVSHRAHASIVGLPLLLLSYAGLEFADEVKQLSQLFQPTKPLVIIIGGAKFGTKLPLVRRFLNLADQIFIGGALAHSFFKTRGYEIGQSLYDDAVSDLTDLITDPRIVLPAEVLVKQGDTVRAMDPAQVPKDGVIVDAGPAVLGQLADLVAGARTLLWNGPLGNYEQGFINGTHDLARLIANRDIYSVIGGGDTIAAIEKLNLFAKFSFISTGGGALLDFLAESTLPGIKALDESEQKFTTPL